MKNEFKILSTGNFYFPIMDKGKKFVVENTFDINLDKKYTEMIEECLKQKNRLYFGMLAKPIWEAFKKEFKKEYKNCWFVPDSLFKLGKDYVCTIDILRRLN